MRAKIVHLITRLDFGGAQQNTLYTVENLDRSKFEAVLLCGPGGHLDPRAKALTGVKVQFIEDLVRDVSPLKDLSAALRLCRTLKELKPAVVHTHSSKAGILGRFAAWICGVPLIIHTFHGFGFHDRQPRFVRRFYIALEKILARPCARLIFVSEANMREAQALGIGDPKRYVLIRSGVRLSNLPASIADRKEIRAQAGIRRDPPLVLSIGNLKPQKNPDDFLKIARAASAAGRASFAFIGDGPARSQLEAKTIAMGLGSTVSFLGWRSDARELLAAADVYLMTSLWEGLPRSLVEAMKSRLPCACYAVDGINDLLIDGVNGFLARPGDWQSLAEKVVRLLKDPALRSSFGQAAAASIGDEFDIDGMVRSQELLLDGLLGELSQ